MRATGRILVLIVLTVTLVACGGSSSGRSRDTTAPVITLTGDNPQVIEAGTAYVELGATAMDNRDGDLSARIVIDATAVDTMAAGDYSVTYDVTDAAGNTAVTVTRTVRVELPPPPAAPQVAIEGNIKQLIFSWDAVANADYYRLMENADGHSGFTQVGDDIPVGTLSASQDIAVHMHDWVNALYIVQACNLGGCTASPENSALNAMLDTIGYFKASNPGGFDNFGWAVAISADGTTLAVGAPQEDSAATGIDGDQSDNSSEDAGAVYVFRSDGANWLQQAYVKPIDSDNYSLFGVSVSLSANGETLAVGALDATYVFNYDGNQWREQFKLLGSNTEKGDSSDAFGAAVSLSADGDTLAVGALDEDSSATGINGDQEDNSAQVSGAAYLFRFDGTSWFQQAYIKASNTDVLDRFGGDLALSGDGNTLLVGAVGEGSGATGVNGEQGDNSAESAGAVYVFTFDGTDWSQLAYIKASNTSPNDGFGRSVDISEDGLLISIGAAGESSAATGVNGDQADNSLPEAGAVYLFRYDGAKWDQESYIKASNPDEQDLFGYNLVLSDDGTTLAVQSLWEDSAATGIGGNQSDNSKRFSGAVYVFQSDGINWAQKAYVKTTHTDNLDFFGHSMAISADGQGLAVGTYAEDSNAIGINGDASDNSLRDAGAVFVY